MTRSSAAVDKAQRVIPEMVTVGGQPVLALSQRQPVLLVFLRHFGCTFCREALQDLANCLPEVDRRGAKLILVHMSDKVTADKYFTKYHLAQVDNVADPTCKYYQAFGLCSVSSQQH